MSNKTASSLIKHIHSVLENLLTQEFNDVSTLKDRIRSLIDGEILPFRSNEKKAINILKEVQSRLNETITSLHEYLENEERNEYTAESVGQVVRGIIDELMEIDDKLIEDFLQKIDSESSDVIDLSQPLEGETSIKEFRWTIGRNRGNVQRERRTVKGVVEFLTQSAGLCVKGINRMESLINAFGCLRYNEMALIRELVEKELKEFLGVRGYQIPFNIWYEQNRQRFENLTIWQVGAKRLFLLGSIYRRCERYEEECQKAIKK